MLWCFVCVVTMSSDRHSSSSPRHSRSLPSSSAASVDATSAAVTSSSSTAATQAVMDHSQSSHVLCSNNVTVIDKTVSCDEDSSLLFEDKSLWSSSFAVLYEFYQTGTFCDVEIHVGTQRINCHRLVLACFSQYFRYTTCSGLGIVLKFLKF